MRAPRSASRSSVGADQRVGPEPPAPAGPTPMPPPRVVAASSGSDPIRAASSTIASVTVRAIGPAVSWLCAIGTMPDRLIKPSVGLMPTNPFVDEGASTDPSVSVPTAAAQRFAATAAAEPELEPEGFRSSAYGQSVSPPRPLQPLVECEDRKFAHSLKLVLPGNTAPASRSFFATNESRVGAGPISANDPAVVIIRSRVSMLSLI